MIDPADAAPRATVLVLHGLYDDKRTMRALARRLASDGARVVLADLRGHGASTGRTLYYGALEGRDSARLVDALAERGLLVEPLGVYGPSYGGAVAHQLAGIEPRVRALITVASFADMPGLLRDYAELSWPAIAWALPDAWLRSLAARVAHHGGFTVDETDCARASARSDARTLLFHGDADEVVPYAHAARLAAACAPRRAIRGCRLVRLRGVDHAGAMSHPIVRREGRAFLRGALALE